MKDFPKGLPVIGQSASGWKKSESKNCTWFLLQIYWPRFETKLLIPYVIVVHHIADLGKLRNVWQGKNSEPTCFASLGSNGAQFLIWFFSFPSCTITKFWNFWLLTDYSWDCARLHPSIRWRKILTCSKTLIYPPHHTVPSSITMRLPSRMTCNKKGISHTYWSLPRHFTWANISCCYSTIVGVHEFQFSRLLAYQGPFLGWRIAL